MRPFTALRGRNGADFWVTPRAAVTRLAHPDIQPKLDFPWSAGIVSEVARVVCDPHLAGRRA